MTFEQLFKRHNKEAASLGLSLTRPATRDEIKSLEAHIGHPVPREIRDFYTFCNGFETLDYLFRVIPLHEALQTVQQSRDRIIDFAEYMIYSDTWTLEILNEEQYVITNANHKTGEVILTNSIPEFLERYFDGHGLFGENGLYGWYEDKRNFT